MKVELRSGYCDDRLYHEVFIDGEEKWSIFPPEPEDAVIGRGLISGSDLVEAIQIGYDLGRTGGQLGIEIFAVPEDNDCG